MKVMSGAGCADADGAQPSSGLKSPESHVNMSESGDTSGFSTTHLRNRGGGGSCAELSVGGRIRRRSMGVTGSAGGSRRFKAGR